MADPELKDLTSTSFGYLMAFLLPGMILLRKYVLYATRDGGKSR